MTFSSNTHSNQKLLYGGTIMYSNNSSTVDVNSVIYRLLDDFPLFGHLYGRDGRLKDEYRHLVYIDDASGNPVLCSPYDGSPVTADPFAAYNLNCSLQDEDDAAMEDCAESGFVSSYRYLNLHNGKSNEFKHLNREDVIDLTFSDVTEKYLPDWLMDQLIAMLRHGKNYASKDPVPETYGDSFLKEQIVTLWKAILIGTIDARDLAAEQTFYALEHADIFRDIAKDRKTALCDTTSMFGCFKETVILPFAGKLSFRQQDAVKTGRRARRLLISDVISFSKDASDDSILRRIKGVFGDDC